LPNVPAKRPYLSQYSLEEQKVLIARGIEALVQCGLPRPTAFRAGNFACNRDTLRALAANGILIDSSVNPSNLESGRDLTPMERSSQPGIIEGVLEYPITVFRDGFGRPRHWQVGSVGFGESIRLIDQARQFGYPHLVLFSHNFEMLIRGSAKPDSIVVSRFGKLCRWLENHSDAYPVASLDRGQIARQESAQTIQMPFMQTASRLSAQIARRLIARLS
ncbi:MAG: hypothetical protein L0Y39_02135, partial [Methylococcaceae bacterium]|nr:hypothetical protein [Methylococcaceae bacterium]